jgi:hypothetical protein
MMHERIAVHDVDGFVLEGYVDAVARRERDRGLPSSVAKRSRTRRGLWTDVGADQPFRSRVSRKSGFPEVPSPEARSPFPRASQGYSRRSLSPNDRATSKRLERAKSDRRSVWRCRRRVGRSILPALRRVVTPSGTCCRAGRGFGDEPAQVVVGESGEGTQDRSPRPSIRPISRNSPKREAPVRCLRTGARRRSAPPNARLH